MKHFVLGALAGAALIATAVGPAQADVIYKLDIDLCSGGCGTPAGLVTLHDVAAGDVHVDVTLFTGFKFVSTGAGHALSWNLKGDPAIAAGNISGLTAGFGLGPANDHTSAGTFDY